MGIEVDLSGLDKLAENAEALGGTHEVAGEELMPDDFIRENTNFQTYETFLTASGIKSQEDIGTEAFNVFIAANTRFANWEEMLEAAGAEWATRKLLSGLDETAD